MSQNEPTPSQTAKSSPYSSPLCLPEGSQPYGSLGDTSQDTQATELASQSFSQFQEENEDLWGYLSPRSPSVARIDFPRDKDTYSLGRAADCDHRLHGAKISELQCS